MALKSDEIFDKIKKRLEAVDPTNRQVEHVYKFKITDGSETVLKSWSMSIFNFYLVE
jgi:hypothetical protein